jgi:hypothetical protein
LDESIGALQLIGSGRRTPEAVSVVEKDFLSNLAAAGQLEDRSRIFNGSEKFPSTFSRTWETVSRRRWSACTAS